jgi:hypothetical protein
MAMMFGSALIALGFIGVGCDDGVSDTADGGSVATRTAALEETSDDGEQAPAIACELPDGPWSRGATLGPDELLEVAALIREQCPELDLDGRIRPDAETMFRSEAETPRPAPTFCTTGQPPSPMSAGTLPGRVEETAVVETRFESDVDLTDRLTTFRESELVDPRSIASLSGVDGTWRPDMAGDEPPFDGDE